MIWQRLTPFRIAVLLGLALSVLRFSQCRYLELVDVRAVDYRLLERGVERASPDIVIVAIDDGSIAKIGRWPWARTVMAQLVDRLVKDQAGVIGFDIVESEPTAEINVESLRTRVEGVDSSTWNKVREALKQWSEGDTKLVQAVKLSDRTVLGYFFDFKGKGHGPAGIHVSTYNLAQHSPSGAGELRVPLAPTATVNLPDLNAAARDVGYFNFIPDPADGEYRRVPLAIRFGDQVAMPLSLAMLRVYWPGAQAAIRFADFGVESVRIGPVSIPVAEDGQMLINYRGPGKTFRYVSAADLLAGRVPADALRGKLVLVGVTATAVADVRATPFDGVLPGVEIHANVLDNILRRDFIVQPRWSVIVEIGIVLACALTLGIVLQYARGVSGALITVGLLVAYLLGSQWVFLEYGFPLSLVYPLLAVSLTYSAIGVQHYVTVERERRKTRKTLELYLSPSLARLVSEHPDMLKLGGEKRERTVLFSDIRGFTSISERLDPEMLVELLNVYLGEMTEVIFSHDGMLDKYIGDAIMAVWGAPLPQADHAARACRAALGMLGRLRRLEEQWHERGWPALHIGIGLNSGAMVFGNMGSATHMSLTVMGDEVNLGSRLEGLSKYYGSSIIASEATVRAAGNEVVARELDLVRVKGKLQPVRIFDILGPASDRERWTLLVERFNAGIDLYRQRRWEEASGVFEAVVQAYPGDGPAMLYVDRCRSMLTAPPAADWDGVTVMEVK
jgi:adenylate cyclase